MNILLRFYLVSCAFILVFLIVGVISRKRDLIVRSVTLFALTQLTCLSLWLGAATFTALTVVVCVLGSNEFLRHFQYQLVTRIGIILLALGLYLLAGTAPFIHYAALPAYVAVTVTAFMMTKEHARRPIFSVAFVTCVIGYGAGFVAHLDVPVMAPVLSFLLLLQCNDAFGYLIGRMLGKTKVFPVLSPKKSAEGYIGGAVGIGIGLLLLVTVIKAIPHFGLLRLFLLGATSFVIGNVGDLLFSAIKRRIDIKDFSNLLPGHGGILDRFDNILFGSPLFYLAWHALIH